LQCHQQPTGSKLYGFYCAYHMLKLKDNSPIRWWDLDSPRGVLILVV
jgi:hypothetical protein